MFCDLKLLAVDADSFDASTSKPEELDVTSGKEILCLYWCASCNGILMIFMITEQSLATFSLYQIIILLRKSVQMLSNTAQLKDMAGFTVVHHSAPFLKATNFVDFVDSWDFHENCFTEN